MPNGEEANDGRFRAGYLAAWVQVKYELARRWCRETKSSSAIVVLARALTGVIDGTQKRELKARLLSVVPSDDLLLSWMRTDEPEQLMAAALAQGMNNGAALCVGTALSNVARLSLAC